eukprot:s2448_g2.t1
MLTVNAFWTHVSSKIRAWSRQWPVFFLGDANAHVGAVTSDAVGSLFSSQENAAGQGFHNWLLEHAMWLPATFETTHPAHAHCTYHSPDAQTAVRIDFVALPRSVSFESVRSFVVEDIDVSLTRIDHLPVGCHVTFRIQRPTKSNISRAKYDDRHIAAALTHSDNFNWLHSQIPIPPWQYDSHQTAAWLEFYTQQALPQLAMSTRHFRRKWYLQDSTWDLIERKKMSFRQLCAMKRSRSHTILKAMFQAWQCQTVSESPVHLAFDALIHDLPTWMRLHDKAFACTQHRHKRLSIQVTEAVRKEDARYYESLAQETGAVHSTEGLNGLWRKLKAVLPKHRSRQTQQRYDLGVGLQKHFEELEAGSSIHPHALLQACTKRNGVELAARQQLMFIDMSELPTLTEVEAICLRQQAHKAPGPDGIGSNLCKHGAAALAPQIHNMLLKALITGVEPFQYKGGLMRAIWKKRGSPSDPSTYRGVLLANTFGKVCHAWARKRLLPTMLARKAPGQLGGLPARQTAMGVHIIRMHSNLGRIRKLSTAVLFIDIRAAFHHLLREFVFTIRNPLTQAQLLQIFDDKERDVSALAQALQHAIDEEVTDVPYALRLLLHDMHQDTWFTQEPDSTTISATRRGTRPGSPIADIGYNLLMARIMHRLQDALSDHIPYVQGQEALGVATPPVAWVDDLAIPLVATTPKNLVPLIEHAAGLMHTIFHDHGLTVNLDSGKTEAVLMFRGAGSNPERTVLFDVGRLPVLTISTPAHVFQLRIVPSYKHLGARFAMDADLHLEVSARIGMARQAFEEQKKPVFLNQHISLPGRHKLYSSLVLSRLMYGTSVWSQVSKAQMNQLESTIIMHHRRMANVGFWTDTNMTDEDFRHKYGIQPF